VYFLVEQRYFNDLAMPREMFARTVGTDQNILLNEAFGTRAYFVGLHVMLGADFGAEDLHRSQSKE
jgi:hypothetical protein